MTSIPPDASCTLPSGSSAPVESREADVCVVGGGMAASAPRWPAPAWAAKPFLSRTGAVLGGNASSEVRMWICGAHGPNNKETGYLEEIQLANMRRNPCLNYPVWDSVLYGIARNQDNLDLILSCAVCEVEMDGPERIASVRAWHLTRQKWIQIRANAFIDCSGDSILRLSGAPCRWGREAKSVSGEGLAKAKADRRTMGNTILIQLRGIDPEDHRPFRESARTSAMKAIISSPRRTSRVRGSFRTSSLTAAGPWTIIRPRAFTTKGKTRPTTRHPHRTESPTAACIQERYATSGLPAEISQRPTWRSRPPASWPPAPRSDRLPAPRPLSP